MRAIICALLLSTLLSACGGGSGGSTPTPPSTAPVATAPTNVVPIVVDNGPAGNAVNVPYVTVTVCQPGSSTQCQTIDHILLDTGSTGLRVLASVLSPALNLSVSAASNGFPLLNCLQFLDTSFTWGPVVGADVALGASRASNVPIQVIADPKFNALASNCATGPANNSASVLGANGVLGVGLFKQDCGPGCASVANNGVYYACTSAACTRVIGTTVPVARQVQNPISLLTQDNNGLVVDLAAVPGSGAATVSGTMYLGIATQSNNQVGSASVLTTDVNGYITTSFAGTSLITSFIDTGSNGLYFDSATVAQCSNPNAGYYCPTNPMMLTAMNRGANGVQTTVSFSIGNAAQLFSAANNAALPTLSGPVNDAQTFDWGLPFFFGRRVYIGMEGQTSAVGVGPYFAF